MRVGHKQTWTAAEQPWTAFKEHWTAAEQPSTAAEQLSWTPAEQLAESNFLRSKITKKKNFKQPKTFF